MNRRRDRQREIAEVLARHWMGYLVEAFGLSRLIPLQPGPLPHERRAEPSTQPEHLRLALAELGATSIKLGRVLSTRPDLLPPGVPGRARQASGRGATAPR